MYSVVQWLYSFLNFEKMVLYLRIFYTILHPGFKALLAQACDGIARLSLKAFFVMSTLSIYKALRMEQTHN